MKVVIAGGTGFIGNYLANRYHQMGKEVIIVSRKPALNTRYKTIPWKDHELQTALEGAELLINLAGKSVNCRYTQSNQKAILQSRMETTQQLGDVIDQCITPPLLWINSSTATIYRNAEDRPMTEVDGEIGHGFSVDIATHWEKVFFEFGFPKTRQVALRIAIVLGNKGGAFPAYSRLAKWGLGGKHGSGNQRFSFVHIHDVFEAIQFIKDRGNLSGVFNVSAPNPSNNRTWMAAIREKLHMPFGLPMPKWILEIAAFLTRTETELLLKSRWVVPHRLSKQGFSFRYPTIETAIDHLLNR